MWLLTYFLLSSSSLVVALIVRFLAALREIQTALNSTLKTSGVSKSDGTAIAAKNVVDISSRSSGAFDNSASVEIVGNEASIGPKGSIRLYNRGNTIAVDEVNGENALEEGREIIVVGNRGDISTVRSRNSFDNLETLKNTFVAESQGGRSIVTSVEAGSGVSLTATTSSPVVSITTSSEPTVSTPTNSMSSLPASTTSPTFEMPSLPPTSDTPPLSPTSETPPLSSNVNTSKSNSSSFVAPTPSSMRSNRPTGIPNSAKIGLGFGILTFAIFLLAVVVYRQRAKQTSKTPPAPTVTKSQSLQPSSQTLFGKAELEARSISRNETPWERLELEVTPPRAHLDGGMSHRDLSSEVPRRQETRRLNPAEQGREMSNLNPNI